ncbi:hypothetical protein [Alkalicoccus urumqiensis]|uniref:hypothetical protein n=1 Tax=Alkalicoccus urumqiensis TaxID=1548213 RepID=UPI0015E5D985|nr:hypothetical protein [Alkalicoccus urumqiensis]
MIEADPSAQNILSSNLALRDYLCPIDISPAPDFLFFIRIYLRFEAFGRDAGGIKRSLKILSQGEGHEK